MAGVARNQDGDEVKGMSVRLFSGDFRTQWLHSWALAMVLWVVAGPVLGQEEGAPGRAPNVHALSAVLMNPATGEILFAKEPHMRLPPASTTKVLTALVALEHLDLNARVPVSVQAASAPPSRIGLHAGEAALTQDLLYGLLLKSGNDAAETLAEAAGGSVPGFAELMNAKAAQVGAHESHFMNPHGLPNDDHYTTAYDLALIFRQAMNQPTFADIVRTRSAALRIESGQGVYGDWRMVPVVSHNRLLASYEGAVGGKTGFTFKARRCFVGEVDRGGVRLIVSILNSPNSGTLWQDARTLLDYGFARYGLAPLPSIQAEPVPIMVRRAPAATPAVMRVAIAPVARQRAASSQDDDDDDDNDNASSQAKPAAVAKAPVKPAVAMLAKPTPGKSGKTVQADKATKATKAKEKTVAVAKADKRPAATKVARSEPVSSKPKNGTKPRS